MSEPESVTLEARLAELEAQNRFLEGQLQLALQMLIRHELTIAQATKGQMVTQTAREGHEKVINKIPVLDNAPLYQLVPTPMTQTKIITTGALPQNGRIH